MAALVPTWSGPARSSLAVLVLAAALLAGCAAFRSSKRLEVGPFAENTVTMIGEVQRATKPVVWIYLKKYEDLPSVQEIHEAARPAWALMRGVALYSTQLVSIHESNLPDSRRSEELAAYLEEAVRGRITVDTGARLFLTKGALDTAVAKVREAKDFMAALGAAQPVVSAALAYGNSLFDTLDVEIDQAASDIDSRVEKEFAPIKGQMAALTGLQLRGTRAYSLLSAYRYGSDASLDTLRSIDPQSADALPAGKRPTAASLDAAEKRIVAQIETAVQVRSHLSEQFDTYKAEQQELDQLRIQAREASRLGRITLILWSRSHRNLAAGVHVPASINVMGIVGGAASKATSTIIP